MEIINTNLCLSILRPLILNRVTIWEMSMEALLPTCLVSIKQQINSCGLVASSRRGNGNVFNWKFFQ